MTVIIDNNLSDADFQWLNEIQNFQTRDALGNKCYLTAEKHFSWENYLEKYYSLYSSLISK